MSDLKAEDLIPSFKHNINRRTLLFGMFSGTLAVGVAMLGCGGVTMSVIENAPSPSDALAATAQAMGNKDTTFEPSAGFTEEIYKKADQSVITVAAELANGDYNGITAGVFDKRENQVDLVTCQHLRKDKGGNLHEIVNLRLRIPGQGYVDIDPSAYSKAEDDTTDTMVLRVNYSGTSYQDSDFKPMAVDENPQIGISDKVLVVGYPLDLNPGNDDVKKTSAQVSTVLGIDRRNGTVIRLDTIAAIGASGSIVFALRGDNPVAIGKVNTVMNKPEIVLVDGASKSVYVTKVRPFNLASLAQKLDIT